MVGMRPTLSVPQSGSRWLRASRHHSSLASRIRRASSTISSPAMVRDPLFGVRSIRLYAERLLELLQLRRQRRLADEAARRGAAEVARVGHRHEVAQVLELQFHGRLAIYRVYR